MNRFCVDCIHEVGHRASDAVHRCTRLPLTVSPVTGKPTGKYPECFTERSLNGSCGPTGTFYLNRADAERKREEDAEKRRKGQYELPFDPEFRRGIVGTDGGDKPE